MLEIEAKEKWRPMIKRVSDQRNCITTECMMWQSLEEPETWKMAREAQIPLKSAAKFGYCGLAGKP